MLLIDCLPYYNLPARHAMHYCNIKKLPLYPNSVSAFFSLGGVLLVYRHMECYLNKKIELHITTSFFLFIFTLSIDQIVTRHYQP